MWIKTAERAIQFMETNLACIWFGKYMFNVFLAFFAIRRVVRVRKMKEVGFLVLLLVLFIINCIIGIIGNNVPLKLAIWGSRNVYRFVLFFSSCVVLLEKKMSLDFKQHFQKYM